MIALGLIIIALIIGIYAYPQMPDKVASHWNTAGEVDGYMNKFWGIFLMPIVMLGVFLLMTFFPYIDPLKKNVKKFRKYYDGFILVLTIFLLYVYLLTIIWNLGYRFMLSNSMMPALAILWYYIGILLENAKRNWFIGIRTPWTLSSDKVWKKTHELGAKMYKASAIIALIGLFIAPFWMAVVPPVISAIILIIYSYVIYK